MQYLTINRSAKKAATDGGGTIVKELPHINGFTYVSHLCLWLLCGRYLMVGSVSYPEGSLRKDTVDLLLSNEHIHVEEDGEVRTQ